MRSKLNFRSWVPPSPAFSSPNTALFISHTVPGGTVCFPFAFPSLSPLPSNALICFYTTCTGDKTWVTREWRLHKAKPFHRCMLGCSEGKPGTNPPALQPSQHIPTFLMLLIIWNRQSEKLQTWSFQAHQYIKKTNQRSSHMITMASTSCSMHRTKLIPLYSLTPALTLGHKPAMKTTTKLSPFAEVTSVHPTRVLWGQVPQHKSI